MVFDVMAKRFRLFIAGLGFRNVNLLRMGRLGQRLQRGLGLEPLAEMTVGVQGTQQRRKPHDLQEQQRTVLANLLQRNGGGKKAVGGLEDIQLCGEEKQSGKQQESDIRRLAVLRPGQELQHSIIAAGAQHKEQELCRQKQRIKQRTANEAGKERRLHRVDDPDLLLPTYLGHESLIDTDKYMRFSGIQVPKALDAFESFTAGLIPQVEAPYEEE